MNYDVTERVENSETKECVSSPPRTARVAAAADASAGDDGGGRAGHMSHQLAPYNFLARCDDESLVLYMKLTCTALPRYGCNIATQCKNWAYILRKS
jgi:hypothetical protein